MAVIAATVVEREFADRIEALGTARARESVDIAATLTETVVEIGFEDGAEVAAGALLVRLEDRSEQAQLVSAKAQLEERAAAWRRARELADAGRLSAAERDRARAEHQAAAAAVAVLEAAIAERRLRAPFAGRVGLRELSVGTVVESGTRIATLDDLSVLKVDFTVPAVALSRLQTGLAVEMRSDAWPGRVLRGALSAIGTRVDPQSRAVTARALLPNPDGALRPGMLLRLELQARPRRGAAIPPAALVLRAGRSLVYLIEDGRAREREVEIGVRQDGVVEIVSGLVAGDRIVAHGADKLRDGLAVQVNAEHDGQRPLAELIRRP